MSLGSELAAARVASGLSIDDVAASTRIRGTLIRAIEDDDFSQCGGAVYARGHVRSIARAVGLDPEPLLASFHPPDVAVAPVTLPGGLPGNELKEAEHQIARKTRPERARWGTAMVAVLVVIIAIVGYGLVTSPGKNAGTPTAATTPTPTVHSTPTPSAAVTPSKAAPVVTTTPPPTTTTPAARPSSEVALVPPAGVTLRINMTGDRSWFHVASSTGAKLFEGIMTKGETKDFTDPKSIGLIVGAPSQVDLVVNGKDIGTLKSSGAVAHQVFYPEAGKNASHG